MYLGGGGGIDVNDMVRFCSLFFVKSTSLNVAAERILRKKKRAAKVPMMRKNSMS